MKLRKFQRRKAEIERKFEEELRALQEAEEKELRRKIDPLIGKISRVAEEEVRRAIEENPDIVETFSFKKRPAAEAFRKAVETLLADERTTEGASEDEVDKPTDKASKKDGNKAEGETAGTDTSAKTEARDDDDKSGKDPFEDMASGGPDKGAAEREGKDDAAPQAAGDGGRGFAPFRR